MRPFLVCFLLFGVNFQAHSNEDFLHLEREMRGHSDELSAGQCVRLFRALLPGNRLPSIIDSNNNEAMNAIKDLLVWELKKPETKPNLKKISGFYLDSTQLKNPKNVEKLAERLNFILHADMGEGGLTYSHTFRGNEIESFSNHFFNPSDNHLASLKNGNEMGWADRERHLAAKGAKWSALSLGSNVGMALLGFPEGHHFMASLCSLIMCGALYVGPRLAQIPTLGPFISSSEDYFKFKLRMIGRNSGKNRESLPQMIAYSTQAFTFSKGIRKEMAISSSLSDDIANARATIHSDAGESDVLAVFSARATVFPEFKKFTPKEWKPYIGEIVPIYSDLVFKKGSTQTDDELVVVLQVGGHSKPGGSKKLPADTEIEESIDWGKALLGGT